MKYILFSATLFLCSCQYSIAYQFYNATNANIVIDAKQVHEVIPAKSFSSIHTQFDFGGYVRIGNGTDYLEYEIPVPGFAYMHKTRKPGTRLSSLMFAIMIIDDDGLVRLGDVDDTGKVFEIPNQSRGYPAAPVNPPIIKK